MAINYVPGAKFGLLYFCQPFGRGIVTVRSVSLSGAMDSPLTRASSRNLAIGTGAPVVVGGGVLDVDHTDS